MPGPAKGVTVVAKLLGGKQIKTDSEGIGRSYKGIGEAARTADREAERSGRGFELFAKRAQKAAKENAKAHHSFLRTATSGATSLLSGGLGMVGLGGVAFGVSSAVKHATELGAIEAATRTSLKGVGQLHGNTMEQISRATEASATRGGFGQDAQLQGIVQFIGETKSATEATKLNTAATNLARGAHLEFSAAQKMIAMGVIGSTGKLQKYLGAITPVKSAVEHMTAAEKKASPDKLKAAELWDKQATARKALGLIEHKYGGASAEFSRSTAGKLSNLKNIIGLVSDKIGKALLPLLSKAATFFGKVASGVMHDWPHISATMKPIFHTIADGIKLVVGWVGHSKVALGVLGGALSLLIGVLVIYKTVQMVNAVTTAIATIKLFLFGAAATATTPATVGLTGAVMGLNFAMLAGVLAFVAVGVGIYEIVKHFDFFENVISGVWHWITGHWPLLAGVLLGPIGFAAGMIITHWHAVVHFFQSIPGKLASVGSGMWDFVKAEFKSVLNFVIDLWNHFTGLFEVPSVNLGPIHYGGSGRIIPKIPGLWEGGTVSHAGAALVGERGPELLSLPAGARVDPLLPGSRPSGQPGTWHGGKGRPLIVIAQIDRKEIARVVIDDIHAEEARSNR